MPRAAIQYDPGRQGLQPQSSPVVVNVQYPQYRLPVTTYDFGALLQTVASIKEVQLQKEAQEKRAQKELEAQETKQAEEAAEAAYLENKAEIRDNEQKFQEVLTGPKWLTQAGSLAYQQRLQQLAGADAGSKAGAELRAAAPQFSGVQDANGQLIPPPDTSKLKDQILDKYRQTYALKSLAGRAAAQKEWSLAEKQFDQDVAIAQAKGRADYFDNLDKQQYNTFLQNMAPTVFLGGATGVMLLQGGIAALNAAAHQSDVARARENMIEGLESGLKVMDPSAVLALIPSLKGVRTPSGLVLGKDVEGGQMLTKMAVDAENRRSAVVRQESEEIQAQITIAKAAFSEEYFPLLMNAQAKGQSIVAMQDGMKKAASKKDPKIQKALEQEMNDLLDLANRRSDISDHRIAEGLRKDMADDKDIGVDLLSPTVRKGLNGKEYAELQAENLKRRTSRARLERAGFEKVKEDFQSRFSKVQFSDPLKQANDEPDLRATFMEFVKGDFDSFEKEATSKAATEADATVLQDWLITRSAKLKEDSEKKLVEFQAGREATLKVLDEAKGAAVYSPGLFSKEARKFLGSQEAARLEAELKFAADPTRFMATGSDRAARIREYDDHFRARYQKQAGGGPLSSLKGLEAIAGEQAAAVRANFNTWWKGRNKNLTGEDLEDAALAELLRLENEALKAASPTAGISETMKQLQGAVKDKK